MATSPSEAADPGSLSPDEAFERLGNDTRIGILQALRVAFESGRDGDALPYSEPFDRVGIDDSGTLGYHLEKLTGPFVHGTDEGDELKQTGVNVGRAVVAGPPTEDSAFGPTVVDVTCPLRDAPVEFVHAGDRELAQSDRAGRHLGPDREVERRAIGGLAPDQVRTPQHEQDP